MGFQTRVNAQPAPAVAGDFAGTNPRTSVTAPPGGYTVAPDYPAAIGGALTKALFVGRFAWFNYATGLAANYFQPASLLGFVHREDQTVIVDFLAEQRLSVQEGFPVTGMGQGDYWADFAPGGDAAGLTVYADPVTGMATAAAAGQGVTLANTASVATTGIMTVTVAGGTLAAGQVVQNAALGLPPGTFITAQLTGGAGSTGTYQLNQAPAVAVGSGTITAYGKQATRYKLATAVAAPAVFTGQYVGFTPEAGSPGAGVVTANEVLTVTAVASGTLVPGQLFAGANKDIPGFAQITAQLTSTAGGGALGGTGTYLTNFSFLQDATETMTATQGTLGKISSWQA